MTVTLAHLRKSVRRIPCLHWLARGALVAFPPTTRLILLRHLLDLVEASVDGADGSVRLLVRRDSALNGSIHHETIMMSKFNELAASSSVIFDVGAEFGIYSLVAAETAPGASIYAFEPDPIARTVLEWNNKKYCASSLNITPYAIGDKDTRRLTTLDGFCGRLGIRPDLIKMDIEGWEYLAIPSMDKLLEDERPTLLMEFHVRKIRERFGVTNDDVLSVLSWIERHDYNLLFNGHHFHENVYGAVQRDWVLSPPNQTNFAVLASPN